ARRRRLPGVPARRAADPRRLRPSRRGDRSRRAPRRQHRPRGLREMLREPRRPAGAHRLRGDIPPAAAALHRPGRPLHEPGPVDGDGHRTVRAGRRRTLPRAVAAPMTDDIRPGVVAELVAILDDPATPSEQRLARAGALNPEPLELAAALTLLR